MKKVDLEVYGMSGGQTVTPILAVVTNPDGTPIGGSGGGVGGEAVTGQVRLNAPALPEGTKTLITLGEFGQPIVEVVIYNPDTGIGATLKQPLTNEELRAAAVPVSGSFVTNAHMVAIFGAPTVPLWDGLTPATTVIAIMKAIHEQNEALKRIGNETNTLLVQVAEHTRHLVPTGG